MRRWAVVGLVVAVGALAAFLLGSGRSDRPVTPASDRPVTSGRVASPAAPKGQVDPAEPSPPAATTFTVDATAVHDACDLDLDTTCDADGCVALIEGPDLDGLAGWLSVIPSRPRFVASVALRDVGVAPAWLPCGDAVARLAPDGVWAAEQADGREVWCAGDVARCDAAAAARFGTRPGSFGPSTRRLRLAPPPPGR